MTTLPCPFCGSLPIAVPSITPGGILLCCSNDACPIHARHMTVEGWNTRMETTKDECRHCGQDMGAHFSRIVPMGYFCNSCGKPWAEQDGV